MLVLWLVVQDPKWRLISIIPAVLPRILCTERKERDVPMNKPITINRVESSISYVSSLFQNPHTLIVVNKTEALVPIFRVAAHIAPTRSTAITAVSLIDHCGMLSGDT